MGGRSLNRRIVREAGGANLPAGTGEVWANNTIVVDGTLGNNSTGTYERIDLPFQTFAAAIAALPTDQTGTFVCLVRSGTYTDLIDFQSLWPLSVGATLQLVCQGVVFQPSLATEALFRIRQQMALEIYGATIIQTNAQSVFKTGYPNFIRIDNCTITNTGGATILTKTADAPTCKYYNSTITTTAGFYSNTVNTLELYNCKVNITAGNFAANGVYAGMRVENSAIQTSAITFPICTGIKVINSIVKSASGEIFSNSGDSKYLLYNNTFITASGHPVLRTNGFSATYGAANNCSGTDATFSSGSTLIVNNYFQNASNEMIL